MGPHVSYVPQFVTFHYITGYLSVRILTFYSIFNLAHTLLILKPQASDAAPHHPLHLNITLQISDLLYPMCSSCVFNKDNPKTMVMKQSVISG